MSPITSIKPFYARLGKVGAGYVATAQKGGKTVTFPQKSKTFVFVGDDEQAITEVARVYGGTVEASPQREEEGGSWRVVTKASEIECVLPTDDDRGFDAWFERWGRTKAGANTLLRRCNGTTCLMAVDTQTGELHRDVPCLCDANDLEGADRCRPTTRLNVLIPALAGARGLGVWQVQSRGWGTYRAIAGTLELLRQVGRVAGTPLLLRIEMRQVRTEQDGQAKTFEVPVIELTSRLSFRDAMAARPRMLDLPDAPLPEPDRAAPPLGEIPQPPVQGAATTEPAPAETAGDPSQEPAPPLDGPLNPVTREAAMAGLDAVMARTKKTFQHVRAVARGMFGKALEALTPAEIQAVADEVNAHATSEASKR